MSLDLEYVYISQGWIIDNYKLRVKISTLDLPVVKVDALFPCG